MMGKKRHLICTSKMMEYMLWVKKKKKHLYIKMMGKKENCIFNLS